MSTTSPLTSIKLLQESVDEIYFSIQDLELLHTQLQETKTVCDHLKLINDSRIAQQIIGNLERSNQNTTLQVKASNLNINHHQEQFRELMNDLDGVEFSKMQTERFTKAVDIVKKIMLQEIAEKISEPNNPFSESSASLVVNSLISNWGEQACELFSGEYSSLSLEPVQTYKLILEELNQTLKNPPIESAPPLTAKTVMGSAPDKIEISSEMEM